MVNNRRRRSGGFTLLELLVASAIFAVLAGIAYATLGSALKSRSALQVRNAERSDIIRALSMIERDVLQAVGRPVIDEFGALSPALLIDSASRLEFTRTGLPNPRLEKRSALQRLAYVLEGDVLLRRVWYVLDRTAQTAPIDEPLLSGVESWKVEAYQDDWGATWPALSGGGQVVVDAMPRALRISLRMSDKEETVRVLPVAGATVVTVPRP